MCRQPKLKPGKVFNCVARPASIFLATALFASARGALFASTWKYLNLWVHSMRGGALVVTGVNRGSPRRNLWQYLIYWLNQPNFSPPGGTGGDDVDHNGNDWNCFVKKSVNCECNVIRGDPSHHWWRSKNYWKATQKGTFRRGMGIWQLSTLHPKMLLGQMDIIITYNSVLNSVS